MSIQQRWIKLTTINNVHDDMIYNNGLNIDIYPFNPVQECSKGELYFCKREYAHRWIHIRKGMHFMWDVELPKNEHVIHYNYKSKAHKIILSKPRLIENDINRKKL
jgi:hypothetical protein